MQLPEIGFGTTLSRRRTASTAAKPRASFPSVRPAVSVWLSGLMDERTAFAPRIGHPNLSRRANFLVLIFLPTEHGPEGRGERAYPRSWGAVPRAAARSPSLDTEKNAWRCRFRCFVLDASSQESRTRAPTFVLRASSSRCAAFLLFVTKIVKNAEPEVLRASQGAFRKVEKRVVCNQ